MSLSKRVMAMDGKTRSEGGLTGYSDCKCSCSQCCCWWIWWDLLYVVWVCTSNRCTDV